MIAIAQLVWRKVCLFGVGCRDDCDVDVETCWQVKCAHIGSMDAEEWTRLVGDDVVKRREGNERRRKKHLSVILEV